MPRAPALAYISTNPVMGAYDRMSARLREERREDRADQVDAAMRRGAADFVRSDKEREGQQQTGGAAASTAAPTPVIEPAPMPTGGGGGPVAVPAQYQADFDAATGGEGTIPGLRPLLASYTHHESGWRPDAVNPDGNATGLGQIRVSTAQQPGFGVQPIALDQRTNPATSLRFMSDYMQGRARALGLTDLTDPAQMRTLLMHVSDPNAPGHIDRIIAGAGGASGMPAAMPQAAQPTAAGASLPARGANPLRALAAGLAQTPGGGQAAVTAILQGERLGMQDQNQRLRAQAAQQRAGAGGDRERFRAEQLAMTALGRGDMTTAQYWAQRAGISLPAGAAQDAGQRQRVAAGSLLARRFYQDRGQAMTFFQTYLRTGNVEQAAQAAGAPRENPRFQLRWIQQGEQEVLAMIDPTGRNPTQLVQPPGTAAEPAAPSTASPAAAPGASPLAGVTTQPPAGPAMSRAPWAGGGEQPAAEAPPAAPPQPSPTAPVTRFRGQGSQARTPAMETRFQMLRRAGVPEQDAAAMAAGAAPSANAVASAYRGVQRDVQQALDLPRDPARRQAEMERRVNEAMAVFGPNWRSLLAGRAPTAAQPQGGGESLPPAPTDPGTAAPAARTAPAPTVTLRDGTVGTLTNDRTPDGRPIYRTQDGRRFAPQRTSPGA